jgi:hypothetical protein
MYGRRTPETFFQALELLLSKGEVKVDDFRLRFIGRFGTDIENMFINTKFANSIESIPYLPHNDSILKLMESDATLLIVDSTKESEEIVPGKVYEYIAVRKPVIAIAPPKGAIADLMLETGCGKCAAQEDIAGIAAIVKQYYIHWKAGELLFQPDNAAINRYERRESAKKLSELLNKLVK